MCISVSWILSFLRGLGRWNLPGRDQRGRGEGCFPAGRAGRRGFGDLRRTLGRRHGQSSFLDHHHPQYTPLNKVDDQAIKLAGVKHANASEDYFRKNFTNPPELSKTMTPT